jgi:hypothetical protein
MCCSPNVAASLIVVLLVPLLMAEGGIVVEKTRVLDLEMVYGAGNRTIKRVKEAVMIRNGAKMFQLYRLQRVCWPKMIPSSNHSEINAIVYRYR